MDKKSPSKAKRKASDSQMSSAKKPLWRRFVRAMLWTAGSAFVLSVLLVLLLRFVNPPLTGIRVYRAFESVRSNQQPVSSAAVGTKTPSKSAALGSNKCWLNLREMGPTMAMAVVAAEDQRFATHHGFDLQELSKAITSKSQRKRGASTISQQVAKNVFLWPGRSYLRKALEAYFTVLIESLWSKQRILEMHLNVVEYGGNIYGACAAARIYFNKAPAQLSPYQAALLAATLPNPHVLSALKPSTKVSRRASWISKQMNQLGGAGYLAKLP